MRHGPFPAGHEHCPAAPKRRNGKIIKPTKRELDSIRRQGDRSFQDTHTQAAMEPALELQPQSQAPGPAINVAPTQPKRKRGSVITAYENTGTSASNDTPTSQASTNGRPRRSTALSRSLNLADLSAQSVEVGKIVVVCCSLIFMRLSSFLSHSFRLELA
jgi:hypothetical protein